MPLVVGACTTRTISTTHRPVLTPGQPVGVTLHGFVEGELVLHFTKEGEHAVAPAMSPTQGWLRFGVPSLDRLNAKYHATAIAPVEGEPGAFRLTIARDANVFRAVEEYGHDPLVARAEPSYSLQLDKPPVAPGAVRTEVPGRGTNSGATGGSGGNAPTVRVLR